MLLGTVCKDVYLVAFQDIVFERTGKQVEVLVEQRLRTYVDVQHRVGRAGGLQAELYAAEFHHVVGKLCARCQRIVGPQLFHGRLLLHFGKPFESVFHGLR